ncbi:hypothetical protein IW261DRAFT_1414719 [Armillaria novae-zelandiae]|uniref:Uncharacterized protein n=1 Tax=Armillaria novae-zelandiae TaxID=153914 RepID=A0AA39PUE4_9AGAR|nr:hypothetical protein IW261DRAFT_1414719 [Armillaria novae-zelandiae]
MGCTPVFIATLFLFFVSQTAVATAQNMSRLLHLASSLELLPALPAVSRPWAKIYPMSVRIRAGNLGTRESTAGIIREALICLFVPAKESVLVPMNTELDLVYAVFCLWSAAFSLFFTDIYNFNAGISGLPFLANPAFDCDFPGLLQAAVDVPPLFGSAFFVNRGLGPGSSLAGAVKVELYVEEAVPT